MSSENFEYDVVEMDFPEYKEEFPPIGEIRSGTPFSANKKEAYRRNREIASEIQEKALAEKERAEAAKKAEFENILSEAKPVLVRKSFIRLAAAAILIAFIAAGAVTAVNKNNQINSSITIADDQARRSFSTMSSVFTLLEIEGAFDEEIDGCSFEAEGSVLSVGEDQIELNDYIDGNISGYIYGQLDDAGTAQPVYVLWSSEPIPDEYKHILSSEEREKLAEKGRVIGYYPDQDK